MRPYIRESSNGLVYVQAQTGLLGPFPRKDDADEIVEALIAAYDQGVHDIQGALRELIGAAKHVGD